MSFVSYICCLFVNILTSSFFFFFFFNDTATTEIYTLSLHDALPISFPCSLAIPPVPLCKSESRAWTHSATAPASLDRKSTRLNSSHLVISYAVFCLKKKKKNLIINFHDQHLFHTSS